MKRRLLLCLQVPSQYGILIKISAWCRGRDNAAQSGLPFLRLESTISPFLTALDQYYRSREVGGKIRRKEAGLKQEKV
jgi:hypothetical protein